MPRPCTVCTHDEREAIDRALAAGEPFRRIAAQHSGTSEASLRRHKAQHLAPAVTTPEPSVGSGDGILVRLALNMHQEALRVLDRTSSGQLSTDERAELRRILTLQGDLLGQLVRGSASNAAVSGGDCRFCTASDAARTCTPGDGCGGHGAVPAASRAAKSCNLEGSP